MKPESIFENILFTTVRIEVSHSDCSISTGTGFIFDYATDGKDFLFIVTNKHVIKDFVEGKLAFNRSDGQKPILGNIFTVKYSNFEDQWINHPQEKIDVWEIFSGERT